MRVVDLRESLQNYGLERILLIPFEKQEEKK